MSLEEELNRESSNQFLKLRKMSEMSPGEGGIITQYCVENPGHLLLDEMYPIYGNDGLEFNQINHLYIHLKKSDCQM